VSGSSSSTTLRIAWRNLWRNRRRTALAVTAIALSVTLVLAYDSVLRAYGDWMVETITGPMLGHVQAHAAGWRQARDLDRTLGGAAALVAALRRDGDVASASARVYAPALAARVEEGFTVVVLGVDAAAESGPARLLAAGTAIGGRRVLVGRPLAERMDLRHGDEVAIVGTGADGSIANDLYTVGGFLESPVDFVNREGIVMDLAEAQQLFALPDEAHEVVIHARDPGRVDALAARLAARPDLRAAEVLDWRALAPEMVALIELMRIAWVFVLVLVFVAAAAGVANTMLMATFERTHEFGMLLALGIRPARIVRLIVAESVILGAVGAALGAALGVGLVAVAHRTGVDYAALTGGGPSAISFAGLRWSLVLYPSLAVADVARAAAAVALTSLVACAWPAARAARLQPVRALRE
jgi:ABC-type lipoprotein release transport system permease subunit